jgi:dGTP triphosphohydrolase
MLSRNAYSIQMNFEVPDSEKKVAEQAVEHFEQLLTEFQDLAKYLDYIYLPFSKYDNLNMEMIVKYRDTFKQYRDQVQKKFIKITKLAYNCVALMNSFSTDVATEEIMNSFMGTIKELEKYMDTFISIFTNLNDTNFRQYLIATVDSIKKQKNQIRQLITDRILEHIDSNILAKDWADNLSEKLDRPIQERVPLVVQLFRERQEALKGTTP